MSLPARRMLNAVWRWSLMKIEPEKREEWVRMMEEPLYAATTPRGKRKPSEAELKADADAFMAAMAGQGKM